MPVERPYDASYETDLTIDPCQWVDRHIDPWNITELRPLDNDKVLLVDLNNMSPGQQIAFVNSLPNVRFAQKSPTVYDNVVSIKITYKEPTRNLFQWIDIPGWYKPSATNEFLSTIVHAVNNRMKTVAYDNKNMEFYREKGHDDVLLIDWVTGIKTSFNNYDRTTELVISFRKPKELVVNPYKVVCSIDTIRYNNNTGEVCVVLLEHSFFYEGDPAIFGKDSVDYKKEMVRKMKILSIKQNLLPKENVNTDRKSFTIEGAERLAVETLREMISEVEYRRYLKNGFISIKASDGLTYQIFRDKWHTKVWYRGKLIEEVCTRLSRNVPPTDNIIAFKTMLECDIKEFRAIGNVYNMRKVA